MAGGQHILLHPEGDAHGGQATKDGVSQVVGKREAGEAHRGRKSIDHHIGHDADYADRKAQQGIAPVEGSRICRQLVIEAETTQRQQQTPDKEHLPHPQPVNQIAHGHTAYGQGQHRQGVGLQRHGWRYGMYLLQIGRRHQDHHHDGGGEHPGQQHGKHYRPLVMAEHPLKRQPGFKRLTGLQLGKHRRLMQPAAQIHGDDAKESAQHKGQTPAPVTHLGRTQGAVDGGCHQRSQQDPRRQPSRQGTAGQPHPARWHMLRHKHPGSGHFATDCRPLQNAQ